MTPDPSHNLVWSLYSADSHTIDAAIDVTADAGVPGPIGAPDAGGAAVSVCVLDSGIEEGHPDVGAVASAHAAVQEGEVTQVRPDTLGDVGGHGTACAGIIRSLAPSCELHSVRVLGPGLAGAGDALLAGLDWAVAQRFDLINMSLSTSLPRFEARLRRLADEAYFRGTAIVASAHNRPVESFPWRFASVISVGTHDLAKSDVHLYNPRPPIEFAARGQDVTVPWLGGTRIRTSGNSFAAAHLTGLCARILSRHPGLTPFQLKSALYRTAANVLSEPRGGR